MLPDKRAGRFEARGVLDGHFVLRILDLFVQNGVAFDEVRISACADWFDVMLEVPEIHDRVRDLLLHRVNAQVLTIEARWC